MSATKKYLSLGRRFLTIVPINVLLVALVAINALGVTIINTDWSNLVATPEVDAGRKLTKLQVLLQPATAGVQEAVMRGETPAGAVSLTLADRSHHPDAPTLASQLKPSQLKALDDIRVQKERVLVWFDLADIAKNKLSSPHLAFHHVSGNFQLCLDQICWSDLSYFDSYFTLPMIVNGRFPNRIIFIIAPMRAEMNDLLLSDAMGVSVRSQPEVTNLKRIFFGRADFLRFVCAAILLVIGVAAISGFMTNMPRAYIDVPTFGATCLATALVLFSFMPVFYLSLDGTSAEGRALRDSARLAMALPMYFLFSATVYTFFRLQRADIRNFYNGPGSKKISFKSILTMSGCAFILIAIAFTPVITGREDSYKIGSAVMAGTALTMCSFFAVGGFLDLIRELRRLDLLSKPWFKTEIRRRIREGSLLTACLAVMFYAYGLGSLHISMQSGIDAWLALGLLPAFVLFFAQQHMIGRNTKSMNGVQARRTPLEREVATGDKAVFSMRRNVTVYDTDFSGFTKMEMVALLLPSAREDLNKFISDCNREIAEVFASLGTFHIKDVADNIIQIFENPSGSPDQLIAIWEIHQTKILPAMERWRVELRDILHKHRLDGLYFDAMVRNFDLHVLILRLDDFMVTDGMSTKSKGDFSSASYSIYKGIEKFTSSRMIGMQWSDACHLDGIALVTRSGNGYVSFDDLPSDLRDLSHKTTDDVPATTRYLASAVSSKITPDLLEIREEPIFSEEIEKLIQKGGSAVVVEILLPADTLTRHESDAAA